MGKSDCIAKSGCVTTCLAAYAGAAAMRLHWVEALGDPLICCRGLHAE